MGYPIQAIHVPKTVDNDLPITDCSPGFGSVAKYVAVSALEASFDVRSMARTSTKVFVLEVMGRHAGWIAAAGGLIEDQGIPVVVLFPEVPFDEAKFTARVDALVKQHGYCTVVVSEGCHHPDGTFLAEQGSKDAFGHAQLGGAAPVVAGIVKRALNYKFHWAVADYLQRAARHIASGTDVQQAYEVGAAAVRLALDGHNAVMPTIERVSDAPYQYRIGMAPLSQVANVEKFMPREFITDDGFGITEACKRYLRPLIQGEDPPEFRAGLPVYATLRNLAVSPKLPAFALR
jgi:6-phosphofructokinase 1